MPRSGSRRARTASAGLIALMTAGAPALVSHLSAQNDLDAFMKDVVARRDDNWKKLQQYILDEREEIALGGPSGTRLWGEERDYTWFIREGFFVRSPVKFNGVTIGEADRRKAEDEYLARAKRRDARGRATAADQGPADDPPSDAPTSVDALLRQSRQPQFISSAYFLRFKFDEGTYALAGREQYEGREVLRVEYYPTKLFSRDRRERAGRTKTPGGKEDRTETELLRLMNKVALVALWIEPTSHQIVKYTFDNVDFDFLPVPWLVRVEDVKASMTMGQAFPDVWLPREIELKVAVLVAAGSVDFHQHTQYMNYREPSVTSRVGFPGATREPGKR